MKPIILIMSIFLYTAASCQEIPASNVPSVVVNTLQAKFSNATDIEWEKKTDLYEAEFEINNIDHKALIDGSGKLVAFKYDIRTSELPAAITSAIASQYKAYTIDDAEKVERNGKTCYQVDLDGKGQDQRLVFTADGKTDNTQRYW